MFVTTDILPRRHLSVAGMLITYSTISRSYDLIDLVTQLQLCDLTEVTRNTFKEAVLICMQREACYIYSEMH